ncbi:hypothetical protein Tco_0537880 [Tanacetum coccineum]
MAMGQQSFVGVPRGRLAGELEKLSLVRDIVSVRDQVDSWRWLLADDGVFFVKGLKEIMDDKVFNPGAHSEETSWCKTVPHKIFSWWNFGCFNDSSSDILSTDSPAPSKLKTVWQAVIWSALYLIWKALNAKILQSKHMVADDIAF